MSAPISAHPPSSDVATTVLGGMWRGIWAAATVNAITAALFVVLALACVIRLYRFARWLPLTTAERDPRRRFTSRDRTTIIARAGGRCEFHSLVAARRCSTTDALQADHIHPHARGGSTSIGNGQALCARHNKQKSPTNGNYAASPNSAPLTTPPASPEPSSAEPAHNPYASRPCPSWL
jgi:hypothetical protein